MQYHAAKGTFSATRTKLVFVGNTGYVACAKNVTFQLRLDNPSPLEQVQHSSESGRLSRPKFPGKRRRLQSLLSTLLTCGLSRVVCYYNYVHRASWSQSSACPAKRFFFATTPPTEQKVHTTLYAQTTGPPPSHRLSFSRFRQEPSPQQQ